MCHGDLIKELGMGTAIAAWISARSGEKLDREAVYKWPKAGIPWKWRPFVAAMAAEKNINLPEDFLPDVKAPQC
jgi:hypothetical protein